MATLDDIHTLLGGIDTKLDDLPERVRISTRQIETVVLSDLSGNLGLVRAGEFRAGNDKDPGFLFSGMRMAYPGMTYAGAVYHLVGVNADVLQFGVRATDGVVVAGAGVVTISASGIIIKAGTEYADQRTYGVQNTAATRIFGRYYGTDFGTLLEVVVEANALTLGRQSGLVLSSQADNGQISKITLTALQTGVPTSKVELESSSGAPSRITLTTRVVNVTQLTDSTTVPTLINIVGATIANFTAGADAIDIDFNLARTIEHATGAVSVQRAIVMRPPTYSFVGASTITDAVTLSIVGAPIAGVNATLTNSYALLVEAGQTKLSGGLNVGSASGAGVGEVKTIQAAVSGGSAAKALLITGGAHTSLAAGAEVIDVDFALNRTVEHATGAITDQRAIVMRPPTYNFVGASTITNAATLAITGAPVAGVNATITNPLALWIQAGVTLFDGNVGIGVANPSPKLHVFKNTTIANPLSYFEDAAPTPGAASVVRIRRPNNIIGGGAITQAALYIVDHSSNFPLHIEDQASVVLLTVKGDGNLGLRTTTQFGSGVGVIGILNATTVPSTNPTGGGILYAEAGAGKWRGSGGTVTTFGPAEPHCPVCGSDFGVEYDNDRTGYLFICLRCLAEEIGPRLWLVRKSS